MPSYVKRSTPEDEKVLPLSTAQVPLAWGEPLIYLAWDAGATPQVSRPCALWDVGCMQYTEERSYFQAFFGATPAAEVCSPVTV